MPLLESCWKRNGWGADTITKSNLRQVRLIKKNNRWKPL